MWFSDIFSCHICSTIAETIGVTTTQQIFGVKKCLENHIWSCWDDSRSMEPTKNRVSFSREADFDDFGVINFYRSQLQGIFIYVITSWNYDERIWLICAKQKETPPITIWLQNKYNNNQWCSVVYRVLDQRRLFWHTKEKFRNTKRSWVFLIFLKFVKIISVGLKLDRPQLQHWLLFLEHI